jgi:hypothetical protein
MSYSSADVAAPWKTLYVYMYGSTDNEVIKYGLGSLVVEIDRFVVLKYSSDERN